VIIRSFKVLLCFSSCEIWLGIKVYWR